MDLSTNKSFLAGALSALSGQSIIVSDDVPNSDPLELGSLAKALTGPVDSVDSVDGVDRTAKLIKGSFSRLARLESKITNSAVSTPSLF